MYFSDVCFSHDIKCIIRQSEAILIGAGSGLSNAAGLCYDNAGFFNTTFPGYHDHYGLRTLNEADFYQFPTPEEQYAYWTRLIAAIRYKSPAGKPYHDLFRIVKDKPQDRQHEERYLLLGANIQCPLTWFEYFRIKSTSFPSSTRKKVVKKLTFC